jgi:hypothetical protein
LPIYGTVRDTTATVYEVYLAFAQKSVTNCAHAFPAIPRVALPPARARRVRNSEEGRDHDLSRGRRAGAFRARPYRPAGDDHHHDHDRDERCGEPRVSGRSGHANATASADDNPNAQRYCWSTAAAERHHRGSSAQTRPPTAAARPTPAPTNFPTARPVPGRPGFVYSLDPNGGIVDVNGYKPGDKAKDPYTKQIFIVP